MSSDIPSSADHTSSASLKKRAERDTNDTQSKRARVDQDPKTPDKCVTQGCAFFSSIVNIRCSYCADPSKALKYIINPVIKSTRPALYYLPVPKTIDTLCGLLQHMGDKSVQQGPGERHQEQLYTPNRNKKLVLRIEPDQTPRRISRVVIHGVQNAGSDGRRVGCVTVYTWDDERIKCEWVENSDGTVEVSIE